MPKICNILSNLIKTHYDLVYKFKIFIEKNMIILSRLSSNHVKKLMSFEPETACTNLKIKPLIWCVPSRIRPTYGIFYIFLFEDKFFDYYRCVCVKGLIKPEVVQTLIILERKGLNATRLDFSTFVTLEWDEWLGNHKPKYVMVLYRDTNIIRFKNLMVINQI